MFIPADDETLLRNAAHGLVAAPHRADGTNGFHGEAIKKTTTTAAATLDLMFEWAKSLGCSRKLAVSSIRS